MSGISRLSVNAKSRIRGKSQKRVLPSFSNLFLRSNAKRFSVKVFLWVTFGSLIHRTRPIFWNFSENRTSFAVLVCQYKLVHLEGKNWTCFIQNLVQNLMHLVLHSESDRKLKKKNG